MNILMFLAVSDQEAKWWSDQILKREENKFLLQNIMVRDTMAAVMSGTYSDRQ